MVYFVLGNHDFHGSSFAMVDKAVAQICRQSPNLYHLGYGEVIELTTQVALIGHRGWPDGKAGYGRNTVSPHRDSKYIADFKGDSAEAVFSKMALLGEASGDYFRKMIPRALMHYQQLLVATHVPPFVWAAHTKKKVCHKKDLPFFTNISAGESIKQCLSSHPGKSLKVLCGHTHRANTYNETPALRVHVAAAKEMSLIDL
jgi:predicted phosphohydrolase